MDDKHTGATAGRKEAAAALGVTPQRINRWVADGAPVALRGRRGHPHQYDVAALKAWRAARDHQWAVDGLSLEQERARFVKAQRVRAERLNRIQAGELIEVAAVRAEYAHIATIVKARLRAVPDSVADQVIAAAVAGPAAVKSLLLARIDDALRELARGAEQIAGATA